MSNHSTLEGFLQAILAEPEDLDHRRILADYLEDHGDPERAEFLRLSLQLAETQPEDLADYYARHDRAEALLSRHKFEWTAGLDHLIIRGEFRRGFVEQVTLTAEQFLDQGELIFSRAPVREVRLRGLSGQVKRVFSSPLLRRVRTLDLSSAVLRDPAVDLLGESPHLRRLEALDLGNNELSPAGVRRLLRLKNLPAIKRLDLRSNLLGADTPDALAEGTLTPQLQWLNLANNQLRDPGGRLAQIPSLRNLRHLDLSETLMPAPEIRQVLQSPHFQQLEEFRLGHNPINGGQLSRLIESCGLPELKRLTLEGVFPTLQDLRALTDSERLRGVRVLSLPDNGLGDEAVAALLTAPGLPDLRCLGVSNNPISDRLPERLARVHLPRLHALKVGADYLWPEAAQRLQEMFSAGVVRLIRE